MNNKQRFKILYDNWAVPIFRLAESYEGSHLSVNNNLNNKKVIKILGELKSALRDQLNSLRDASKS